jgi:nitrate reductase delta subunit
VSFGTLRHDAAQDAALAQVRAWVQERFSLPADAAVLVAELACELPGCPPLETVIAFWTDLDVRHHYKVFKPAQQVQLDDLPPYWMKAALAVPPDWAGGCC